MNKCHCAEVLFDEIVQLALKSGKDYIEVMNQLGAAQICTACKLDLISYCESKLSEIMKLV